MNCHVNIFVVFFTEIFGISDHDLLFSVQQSDTEKLADVDQRFIGDHVSNKPFLTTKALETIAFSDLIATGCLRQILLCGHV